MPITKPALPWRRGIVCCICLVILTIIFLGGLVVLITWLTIKPKRLDYIIEDVLIQNYNLTDDNHLSAKFQFTIQSHNPNRKISIYYDSIEVFVKFNQQTLAFDTIEPFHQPSKNITQINDSPLARNVAIPRSDAKDMRVQTKLGKMELDVYIRARVRFKVGIWKSAHHTVKIECSPVSVSLSHPNKAQRSYCDVDL